MKYLQHVSLIIFIGTFFSCQKKLVHKIYPEFVGRWRHIENSNEKWYIDIGKNSSGTITLYDSLSNFITAYGENPHRFRVKEGSNTLYFDFFDKLHINSCPTEATSEIIEGMDTIKLGETYMVLDENYFVKY